MHSAGHGMNKGNPYVYEDGYKLFRNHLKKNKPKLFIKSFTKNFMVALRAKNKNESKFFIPWRQND